ncbi:MAG: hypothetical protein QM398_10050 [Thermoproteota archaeon]|nr:hypothetical protein [Thermoproteota archaeon]
MERKPLQPAIYQGVIDDFQAKAGDSYNEVQYKIRAEYERRCQAYTPDLGVWEGDVTQEQINKRDKFIKKYQDRGKLKPFQNK